MSRAATELTRDATPACPVCEERHARREYEVRGYHLWRCRSCGVRSIHPRPDVAPAELYDADYFQGGKDGIGYADYVGRDHWYPAMVYSQIRERLLRAYPERGRMLDVGCASGHFVKAAVDDGWDAIGIDPGEYVVDRGREMGLDLRATTLADAAFPEASFDVVCSFHTVEHLPDPAGDLREARRIAREGAMLVVEVPNIGSAGALVRRDRWSQLKPPEHINFFNRRTMARIMRMTGWRPIRMETLYVTDVTVAVGPATGGPLRRAVDLAGTVAKRAGVVRAAERLGLGGNLRAFAVTAPVHDTDTRRIR